MRNVHFQGCALAASTAALKCPAVVQLQRRLSLVHQFLSTHHPYHPPGLHPLMYALVFTNPAAHRARSLPATRCRRTSDFRAIIKTRCTLVRVYQGMEKQRQLGNGQPAGTAAA